MSNNSYKDTIIKGNSNNNKLGSFYKRFIFWTFLSVIIAINFVNEQSIVIVNAYFVIIGLVITYKLIEKLLHKFITRKSATVIKTDYLTKD